MTPYLLLVVLSVGLPVSIGSGELSSLELLAKKIREVQDGNIFYSKYFSEHLVVIDSVKVRYLISLCLNLL